MIKMYHFKPTEKSYLRFLYVSVISTAILLCLLILTDVRLNILGEPFGDYLKVISIAISRLSYGIEGFVGLKEVLEVLKQIPNFATVDINEIASVEIYQSKINEIMQQSLNLSSVNSERVHAVQMEMGYTFFTIAAFSVFGIKIQSLSFLFIALFFISVCCYMITYRKSIPYLLVLCILIFSIALVVIANPKVGINLITVYNYRFITILGLIPIFHLVFKFKENESSIISYILLAFQIFLLIFLMLSRGSAQWMLIAMILVAACFFWLGRKKLANNAYATKLIIFKRIFGLKIILPLIMVLLLFIMKSIFPYFQHKEYRNDIWLNGHVIWHSALVGVTTDPVLMNKYVCSDKVLEDRLMGFSQVYCDKKPRRFPRLYYGIFLQPSDMHGYQAAIKYLREHGSNEQIGAELVHTDHFNARWKRHDEIVREVYFEMIRKNPVDVLYMFGVAKPLKFLKESLYYSVYFVKSIVTSPNPFYVVSFLSFILIAYFYLMQGYRHLLMNGSFYFRSEVTICLYLLLICLVSSLAPAIFIYSQPHTISDSVTIIIALILWLPLVFKTSKTSI
jgi:hypothetical protein